MVRFRVIKDVVYSKKDGLHCDIFIPDSKKPKPVLIQLFGGGWEEGDKKFQTPISQSLAKEGYASVAIEYRLAPKHIFPSQIEDIKAALRFIKANSRKYGFDVNKIGIAGISAGGNLAVIAGMTLSGFEPKIRCAVSFHGPMDLVAYSKYDLCSKIKPRWAQVLVHQLIGGGLKDLSRNARKASPFHLASKGSAPIMFIASRKDGSVPFQYAQKTAEKLRRLKVPVAFLLHASGFHEDLEPAEIKKRGWKAMWNRKNPPKLMFHKEVLAFLRRHLA